MTGEIFDIKHFAIHDGQGIRTTIFFKGCPLRCVWCHNPEGLKRGKDIWVKKEACINCEKCVESCPKGALCAKENEILIDKSKCDFCNVCVNNCPSKAIRRIDQKIDTKELVRLLKREDVFSKVSGGGVTVSGGEPLFQPEFLKELLMEMKEENIDTCIETSMFAPFEVIEEIEPYVDRFIVDIKLFDKETHKKYTGVSNTQILSNFQCLSGKGKPILVRIPLIPGITATKDNLTGIGEFVKRINPQIKIELLNFNSLAMSKYHLMGEVYYDEEWRMFSEQEMKEFYSYLEVRE